MRHPAVLIVAFGLMALALGLLQGFVASGRYTAIAESLLLIRKTDTYGHVGYQVAYLKQHPPSGAAVYLFGGSSARECIGDETRLSRQITRLAGRPTVAYDLASPVQGFGGDLTILDNLPSGDALLLIGISPNRFTEAPARQEQQLSGKPLLLDGPSLRAFTSRRHSLKLNARTILPGVFNYGLSYLKNRLPRLRLHRLEYTHGYPIPFSDRLKRRLLRIWLEEKPPKFAKYYDYNSALLTELVARARQRGFRVALVETPENLDFIRRPYEKYKALYRPLCDSLRERYGVAYIDFVSALGLRNADYRDMTHIIAGSRVKFQDRLGLEAARLLGTSTAGGVL